MIKTFEMKITVDTDTTTVLTETCNDGFNSFELLGLIELKKHDILYQIHNPQAFTRTIKNENGESEEIICTGGEDK